MLEFAEARTKEGNRAAGGCRFWVRVRNEDCGVILFILPTQDAATTKRGCIGRPR